MTNLDSILKSQDITLPTKVCLVKALVFPVVIQGCESGRGMDAQIEIRAMAGGIKMNVV